MTKHPNFRPLVGTHWVETLSDDELILNELKKLGLSSYLKQSKTDLTQYGKNKRLVLRHITGSAILVWEKQHLEKKNYRIQCVLFVNNSSVDSMELLEESMKLARLCWIEYPFNVKIDPKLHPNNAENIFVKCGWTLVDSTGNVPTYTSDFGLPAASRVKQAC